MEALLSPSVLAILKFKRLIPVLSAAYSAIVLYSALN